MEDNRMKLSLKMLVVGLLTLLISSCQQTKLENTGEESSTFPDKQLEEESTQLQAKVEDDFSDLKQKDESCDTEEDLEKKIEEQARKKKAFQLQGGDENCEVQ